MNLYVREKTCQSKGSSNLSLLSLLVIFLFTTSLSLNAQSLRIEGNVFDGLSEMALDKCQVQVFNANKELLGRGTTVKQVEVFERGNSRIQRVNESLGAKFAFRVDLSKPTETFLLTINKKGYEGIEKVLSKQDFVGKKRFNAGDFYLLKARKVRQLDEVLVKATKIKMLYKGDTIVYNADAFNISQMDKLRSLVAQLPSAKFENGVLSVNGRVIENMTISGKDFFNGNINAVLDNLPAYIVSKLKVYEKAGEMSKLTGRDMYDKTYVMDVKLKREYIGTWVAIIGAEAGTENLWGSSGMITRMDDRQMFLTNYDANNLNKKREVTPDWTDVNGFSAGQRTAVEGGANYFFQPNQHWRVRAEAKVKSIKTIRTTNTNRQTFLYPQNLIARSASQVTDKLKGIRTFGALRYRKGKHSHELTYTYDFNKSDLLNEAQNLSWYNRDKSEKWSETPLNELYQRLEALPNNGLLFSLLSPKLDDNQAHSHQVSLVSNIALGLNVLKTNLNYQHKQSNSTGYQNYALRHYLKGSRDFQRRYTDRHSVAQSFNLRTEYEWRFIEEEQKNAGIRPYLKYNYANNDVAYDFYRLDWLKDFQPTDWTAKSLGLLPDRAFKEESFDKANSYNSLLTNQHIGLGLQTFYKTTTKNANEWDLNGDIECYYLDNSLDYQRNGQFYPLKKNAIFIAPKLRVKWKEGAKESRAWMSSFEANYSAIPYLADLFQLIPIRDESDPLNIFLGNKDLKNSLEHRLHWYYSLLQSKKKHSINWQIEWRHTTNDFVMQSDYNSQTGVRTYSPQNSNLSHWLNTKVGYTLPLGRGQSLWLTTGLNANYRQGEILARMDGIATNDEGLLKVFTLTPSINLRANIGDKFSMQTYWQTDFQRVQQPLGEDNYRKTRLSSNITWKLPWDLTLYSQYRLNIYEGYNSPSLNRIDNLWDISLHKYIKFKRGSLSIGLEGKDILAQRNNISVYMNSQFREETYTNVLPRHFLLSFTYRTNWTSKSKKAKASKLDEELNRL